MTHFDLKTIKSGTNIIEVARTLGFNVSTANRTNCLRPENHQHADVHPSLVLNPRKNRFWCPVCPNTRGDVIEFVKLARKCSFNEAVEFLSSFSSAVPQKMEGLASTTPSLHFDASQPKLSEFDDIDQCFFELLAQPTEQACAWLESRGIPQETANTMRIRSLVKRRHVEEKLSERFTLEQLIASGLLDESGTLPFERHRLIWTYFQAGKPVYFQGRALDSNVRPKEMCIKRTIPCPYNVDVLESRPTTIIVCEGVVDSLTLVDRGFPVVGVVGVHGFKSVWIDLFKRIKVKVAFDADLAGQAAAIELVQQFRSHGIEAEKVYLPEGCDVNRFFLAYRQFCA